MLKVELETLVRWKTLFTGFNKARGVLEIRGGACRMDV